MTALIMILQRTETGWELLRLVLPFALGPDRPNGNFPDGSLLYNTDPDAVIVDYERDVKVTRNGVASLIGRTMPTWRGAEIGSKDSDRLRS